MASVNQEQIIGSFIPDVYIRKVTLESAGVEVRETNPHIEHSREATSVYRPPTDKSMKVTLDLLLKEKLDTGLIDTWFSNQEFQKYLQFTVIQSTDPLVTKLLSTANNAIQIATMNSMLDLAVFLSELMDELKDLPEFSSIGGKPPAYTEKDIPELIDLVVKHTRTKKISVLDHMNNNRSILDQQYRSVTDDGSTVYDFTFRMSFDMSTASPNHLTYFAVSSVDVEQLIEDHNLDTSDSYLFKLMSGKVAADAIVRNSKLVSKSFVFKDRDDNIWTGPTHLSEGVFLTGTPNSETKQPLKRVEVENSKVQDFRVYDRLEKYQLDFSVVENKQFNRDLTFKRLTNDNMDVLRVQNYFSENALAHDSVGQCRFAFTIDYGKMIRDYTKYGSLYSENNQQELFSNVKIKNLSVIRRRVTADNLHLNRLGSPSDKRKIFNDEELVEVICRTGEVIPGKVNSVQGATGAVQELSLELDSDSVGIRHFTGCDYTMPVITDGHYQYGVEIEVEDKTDNYIRERIRKLGMAKHELDKYSLTAHEPRHYDALTNRFTQEFIDKMNDIYGFEEGKILPVKSPWISPLITYLSVLSLFRKTPIEIALMTTLATYVKPESGNPRGIDMVSKLIENLMHRLSSVTGVNLVSQRSKGFRADSSGNFVAAPSVLTPGKPRLKTFKLQHYFPQTFDSNMPKNIGYDFLSRGKLEAESNNDGLRIVSSEEFIKRTELESLKYFNNLTDDISMKVANNLLYTEDDTISKTQLTYLTPSNVNLGSEGNFSLLNEPFDSQKSLAIQTTIANLNLMKRSPFLPFVPQVAQNNNEPQTMTNVMAENKNKVMNIMANYNCTLVSHRDNPIGNIKKKIDEDYDPYTDVGTLMGNEYMGIDDVDVPAVHTDIEQRSEVDPNKDPTQLFTGLAFPLFTHGVGMGGLFSKFNIPSRPVQSQKKKTNMQYTVESYSLTNSLGYAALFAAPDPLTSPDEAISPALTSDTIDPQVKFKMAQLPNQVKSLFLSSINTNVIRYSFAQERASLIESPVGKSAFALNYKMIRKTEVLMGYSMDDEGYAEC
jgi:hypothetical protein